MKFENMLTFWKLKGMIHNESIISSDEIYDSHNRNVICKLEVRDLPRYGNMHSQIIYRYTSNAKGKSKFALVYADVLFTGFNGRKSTVFIKKAKISDLQNQFIPA